MQRLAFSVAGLILLVSPVSAQDPFELVPQQDGATACWQRVYDEGHLAAHPRQSVTTMTFAAGFYAHDEPEPEDAGLTLFGMTVTLRDGTKGYTSGGCWPGEGGLLRCGVDCDGGGVAVSAARNGGLLIDLEATGYIRMEGECGSDGEAESFSLEPGADDRQFRLPVADAKACKGLLPVW
ncbi:hypothetical protein SAMN06295905_0619 [Devosia lucknowensis]|uniref:Invasion protein IalB, involved in pathogenesis n=2 Tax=Devosia lucknowensis TaxID=1096929 RepID=A0A1Y6EI53_9HYPH|nr:hypothetical protein SAMN06295905_0619 [Devosia lucknowensis]